MTSPSPVRTGTPVDVVLLVPGLLGPGGAGPRDPDAARALVDGLDLDGLDRLLARAEHTADPADPEDPATDESFDESFEALVFRSFGDPTPPAGSDWPVAAFTALVDCGPGGNGNGSRHGHGHGNGHGSRHEHGSGFRLRADPVHLRADLADLVLFNAADIDVSGDEAGALARTVNDALRPDGPFIDAAHPHRWYVAPDAPTRVTTTPLSLATGARVSAAMPRGSDAPRWHRWMNEAQMALHECPVNVERERRGAAPVNSVWLWGAGSLPSVAGAPARFVQVWSDDVLVRGRARHGGVEGAPLPDDAGEWLDRTLRPGAHLAVFAGLHGAARRADLDAWRAGLAGLSAAWAQPLLDALNRGAVARVSVHDERGHRFTATRRGRFRWRRGRGLATRIADACR